METLEKVENMHFTRMNMSKEQKKLHRKALREANNQNQKLVDVNELNEIDVLLNSRHE